MPKVGDRVIVEGVKLGNPRREGTCVGIVGRLLSVRWSDGTTSMFTPGAGSVRFESGNGRAGSTKPAGSPSKKKAPAKRTAPTVSAKKPPKASAAKKPAAKKAPPPKKRAKKR